MPLGLRTKFKVTDTKFVEVYQKPWSSILNMSKVNRLNYIVVLNDNGTYTFIDNDGEYDGFDSFAGAEQFARAYIKSNFNLSSTRTTPNLKLKSGLRLNTQTGDYIER